MPWCRFFIPKIAATNISPEDPDLNEHIMYAKCVKGHVLKDANDWVLCENLPAADAKCWQEGGDTIFSLRRHERTKAKQVKETQIQDTLPVAGKKVTTSGKSKA